MQRVHVGPAAPQAHVGAQRDELRAEAQRGGGVTCTGRELPLATPPPVGGAIGWLSAGLTHAVGAGLAAVVQQRHVGQAVAVVDVATAL